MCLREGDYYSEYLQLVISTTRGQTILGSRPFGLDSGDMPALVNILRYQQLCYMAG